jgi:cytoskeletal protein CcmA (bactofilin family)
MSKDTAGDPGFEPAAVWPARRFTDSGEPAGTVLGPRTQVRGELTSEGSVEISGTLHGDCRAVGLCRVRAGGRVEGSIRATSIVVEGEVAGKKLEAQRVEIGASARVHSDIHADRVAIAEGGFFQGDVQMGTKDAQQPTVFKEKRGPAPEAGGQPKA